MVSQIELFTKRLALAGDKDPLVVVINPNRFCNAPLTEMYGRAICMIDDRFPHIRKRLVALREKLKAEGSPIAADIDPGNPIPHMRGSWNNFQREFAEVGTILRFTDDEEARGQALLGSMNIADNAPFICVGIREKTYYRNAWVQDKEFDQYWEVALTPEEDADAAQDLAHDEAQKRLANMEHVFSEMADVLQTPIENYLPMMEKCAAMGLYVLRMGLDVDQPLPPELDPKVIDYASDHRTEFGDVYLFAKCKFLVSGAAGNNWIPQAFGRPFVVTDLYLPNAGVTNSCPDVPNLFIPRKYWVKDEKRFLNFREMLNCCRYYNWAQHCIDDGIEHVPNSADEIWEVIDEMNQRVDGTWHETPEDAELQSRYMALYRPHHEGYKMNGRIGTGFLRRHASLL